MKKIITYILTASLVLAGTTYLFAKDNKPEKFLLDYKINGNLETKVQQIGNKADVDVYLTEMNQEELENYRGQAHKLLNSMAKQNYKNAPVMVTFPKPIPLQDFAKIVNKYDFDVDTVYLRAVPQNNNDEKITVRGSFDNGSIVNENALNEFLKEKNADLKGVIYFNGQIDLSNNKVSNILLDEKIYLVDASSVVIAREVKSNLKKAGLDQLQVEVDMTSPYWYLENQK